MDWASFPKTSSAENNNGDANGISEMNPSYVVQIVRQVNYGPLESKRYFIAVREKAVLLMGPVWLMRMGYDLEFFSSKMSWVG
jgi:hypothetical protein